MLVLILIHIQYLQDLVFSFENGSNVQNHSLSDSHHSIKKFPQQSFLLPYWGDFPAYPLKLWGIYNSLQNLKIAC